MGKQGSRSHIAIIRRTKAAREFAKQSKAIEFLPPLPPPAGSGSGGSLFPSSSANKPFLCLLKEVLDQRSHQRHFQTLKAPQPKHREALTSSGSLTRRLLIIPVVRMRNPAERPGSLRCRADRREGKQNQSRSETRTNAGSRVTRVACLGCERSKQQI